MQIILENEVKNIQGKYTVLELDQLRFSPNATPVTAYCVIDNEKISLTDVFQLDQVQEMHQGLIKNYRLKNWSFCEQAIKHLYGKFHGELDSFYEILLERIKIFKETDPGENWDAVIEKY